MSNNLDNKSNILYTTKHHLCLGCGLCKDTCPTSSINIESFEGLFIPSINEKSCLGAKCSKCVRICPGLGVDLKRIGEGCVSGENHIKYQQYIGRYTQLFTGFCNNLEIRYHSSSGGMVTSFLIYLLEKKIIDGAVITKFDRQNVYFVNTFIANTKEEVLQAKSSKYSPVAFNDIVNEIKLRTGKFIIVGLPCHIHGFRKYAEKHESFSEKIFGYFGLYCSGTRNFNYTEYILEERNFDKSNINYLAYRDEGNLGGLVVEGINREGETYHYYEDYQKYSHPLGSLFTPKRCFLCIDHFAELADISFGDIHTKPFSEDKIGINSIIVRNSKFESLLTEAEKDGVITLSILSEDILLKSQPSAKLKKERTATFLKIERLRGRRIPQYDVVLNDPRMIHSILSYIKNSALIFIGRHKKLWFLIPMLKAIIKKQ